MSLSVQSTVGYREPPKESKKTHKKPQNKTVHPSKFSKVTAQKGIAFCTLTENTCGTKLPFQHHSQSLQRRFYTSV